MLSHQRRQDSTRSIPGLLASLIVAAAVAGCADTPTRHGLPWWSQGPGDVSEDARATASVAEPTGADTAKSPPAQASDPHAQAVRYGDLLFVSGQIADDYTSRAIVGNDIQAQVRTAMDNINRILESHGLTMSNVLSVALYLQDLDELPRADEAYASYFQRGPPARSVVRVSGLPKGSLVEISVIAGR